MNQTLELLSNESLVFPPLENALTEPNGLLAVGGDLSVERLCSAYHHGAFPWYSDEDPIMWWSPDPRAIITTSSIKINRTLRKVLKQKNFTVSINKAFDDVISLCADAPFRKEDTWIVSDMIKAYKQLHQQGHAHSIEVWQNDELVGGLYGVAVSGYFSGESMFYKVSNASKIALVALAQYLESVNITMIDCQMLNPFLEDMGCTEVSRDYFIALQKKHLSMTIPKDFWLPKEIK
ncbi:leucyl/phenylalanyl-tRNA--protein transferase [Pseudocolwellia agarivorans]|uniref:leucyl/phenylalanyl-tRNA--protein transferase n=1 Tax=Pseudocolwellia agarivorans TaxID=1911682 RepID=UPI003F885045